MYCGDVYNVTSVIQLIYYTIVIRRLMAGHSQFKNIMYRKGAQDAKRAKIFAKLSREIMVAAKLGGEDITANPRLRTAIAYAREQNMPKDNIEKALAKARANDDLSNYDEIRYEGYGLHGVAFIVEALTDNKNRTASEVRSIFTKCGGNLGESGSVAYQFNRIGVITYRDVKFNDIFDYAIEVGAKNAEESMDNDSSEHLSIVTTDVDNFAAVRDGFLSKFGDPAGATLTFEPLSYVEIAESDAQSLLNMINILEDNDDVQKVYHNLCIV